LWIAPRVRVEADRRQGPNGQTTIIYRKLISSVHSKATQRIVAMTALANSETANLCFHPPSSEGSSFID
jgi:hypothetical protein